MRSSPRSAIYVSYNSVFLPLVESQVVAYLSGLHDRSGYRFRLVTFEPRDVLERLPPGARDAQAERLQRRGIRWTFLRYHGHPSLLATLWDIAVGALVLVWLALRERPSLIHARGHVPAASAVLATGLLGVPFLFDCRGLLADEYADAGHWRRGSWKYRLTKWAERWLFRRAAHVVVLTERLRVLLRDGSAGLTKVSDGRITVIPCCVDVTRFAAPSRRRATATFTLCYVGSVGTWYLLSEMLDFAVASRAVIPGLRLLVLNRHDHALIRAELEWRGLADITTLRSADVDEVPGLLADASAGMAFILPSFSKQASSPTKFGEYLAAGLPVVANAGVGDVEKLLDGVGVLLQEFTASAYREAAGALLELVSAVGDLPERCRARAEQELSLDLGVRRYAAIYERLESRQGRAIEGRQ